MGKACSSHRVRFNGRRPTHSLQTGCHSKEGRSGGFRPVTIDAASVLRETGKGQVTIQRPLAHQKGIKVGVMVVVIDALGAF